MPSGRIRTSLLTFCNCPMRIRDMAGEGHGEVNLADEPEEPAREKACYPRN